MYAVFTTAKLEPGTIDQVAALFDETNPDLVEDQQEWLGARFTANRERDTVTVTVIAIWSKAESYRAFSSRDAIRSTMAKFGPFFADPTDISINGILIEMGNNP